MENLSRDELFRYICNENPIFVNTLKQYVLTLTSNKIYIDEDDDLEKDIKLIGISHYILRNTNVKLDKKYIESGWIFPYDGRYNKNSFYYGYELKLKRQVCSRGISFTKEDIENIKNDINTVTLSEKDITMIFDIDEFIILCNKIFEELEISKELVRKTTIVTNYKAYTILFLPYVYIILHMIYVISTSLNIF